jgi:hypothetical protein
MDIASDMENANFHLPISGMYCTEGIILRKILTAMKPGFRSTYPHKIQ